jgi:hypothetical protein
VTRSPEKHQRVKIPLAETRLTSVRYKRLDDLVKFVGMTPQPFLNHLERDGKHLYFFVLPFSGGLVVYYVEADKKLEGEYISINRMSGKFSSSSRPTFEAQSIDLPILEVEATDLLENLGARGG